MTRSRRDAPRRASARAARRSAGGGLLALAFAAAAPLASAQVVAANDLADFTLEELANVQVTSVTGRPESAQDAAASIFVITADAIRRSTATNLPEALRLAPNLQVARLNAGQYAISARGSNNAIGNKLLVLIDGRTVYSPLFSGVFWDAQDVVLRDVERIEVISGPGATLWGANAVNGVINVITRPAAATQGVLASATAGPDGSETTLRYGAALGESGHFRVYATRLQRDNTERVDGVERADASSKAQLGFRADWRAEANRITLQGDTYRAGTDSTSNLAPKLAGSNLLARWSHELADGANWQLQAYVDESRRDDDILFRDRTRTVDVRFDVAPAASHDHKLLWGGGYRHARSEAPPSRFVRFVPEVRELQWANVFVQDEIRVSDPLRVTLGAKLESNVYTGVEVLPTLRVAYTLPDAGLLWGALSRAVRAPSRTDRDFHLPATPPYSIDGGPDFQSEVADVLELGYRAKPSPWFSYAVTAFDHRYDKLRGGTPSPTFIENRVSGHVYGVEAWGTLEVNDRWRLSAGLVELRKSLHALPGSSTSSVADLGNDPKHQWMLRSTADLMRGVAFDVTLRHVSALPQPAVAAYTATDLRLAWQATRRLGVALLVANAFDRDHIEFNAVAGASQIPRSAFLRVEYQTE